MLTEEELGRIEQLLKDATAGPWAWENPCGETVEMRQLVSIYQTFKNRSTHVGWSTVLKGYPSGHIGPDEDADASEIKANLELIAECPTLVSALVAEVRRLRAQSELLSRRAEK